MTFKSPLFIATILFAFGCNTKTASPPCDNSDYQRLKIREEIQLIITNGMECAKKKDIEGFMASTDSTFIMESNEAADKDRTILKDTIKKDILQSWSIIADMYEAEQWIDSIYLPSPDTAIVFTDQLFHRSFLRPNNQPGKDDILSTQRHRETWIKRATGWKQSRLQELGGSIYVNGELYTID